MNPEEFKINSSLLKNERIHGGSLLPGVAYDRQVATQQRLIEKFLRGGWSCQILCCCVKIILH